MVPAHHAGGLMQRIANCMPPPALDSVLQFEYRPQGSFAQKKDSRDIVHLIQLPALGIAYGSYLFHFAFDYTRRYDPYKLATAVAQCLNTAMSYPRPFWRGVGRARFRKGPSGASGYSGWGTGNRVLGFVDVSRSWRIACTLIQYWSGVGVQGFTIWVHIHISSNLKKHWISAEYFSLYYQANISSTCHV